MLFIPGDGRWIIVRLSEVYHIVRAFACQLNVRRSKLDWWRAYLWDTAIFMRPLVEQTFRYLFLCRLQMKNSNYLFCFTSSGPLANVLTNRFDYRPVALISAPLTGIILVGSACIDDLEAFGLFFGICGGELFTLLVYIFFKLICTDNV